MQGAGQERQSDFGEKTGVPGSTEGQLRYEAPPQKEFGFGEGETLNPLHGAGHTIAEEALIPAMNKAQELYGKGQEVVGNVVEGAGNLYNKAIDAGGRAYNTLAETVEAGKDAVVDTAQAVGKQAAETGGDLARGAKQGWNHPQQGLIPVQGEDGKMKLIGNNPVAPLGSAMGGAVGEAMYGEENRRLAQNMSQEQLDQLSAGEPLDTVAPDRFDHLPKSQRQDAMKEKHFPSPQPKAKGPRYNSRGRRIY